MFYRLALTILLPMAALALPSCKAVSSIIHDGEVVAKLGDYKLYLSELEAVIPPGTSPEDSTNLANAYIDSWVRDKAFSDMANEQLSKEEKDVTKELEAYRQALLRYRFEQRYVNERLDTAVTDKQVSDYYQSHLENFRLDRPILKARYMNIAKDSPNLKTIKRLMSSSKVEDVVAADSIAFNSARKYRDFSEIWIDAVTLAAEFGTDYTAMLSQRSGNFIEIPDGEEFVNVAYVVDFMRAGETAPEDFVSDRIKDIIISSRKHDLLVTLERELIEEAKLKENFEIYSR